jgi:hypothetical protein
MIEKLAASADLAIQGLKGRFTGSHAELATRRSWPLAPNLHPSSDFRNWTNPLSLSLPGPRFVGVDYKPYS